MGRFVTAQRYRCSACSEWVEKEDEVAQTRQLEHVSWIRTWVHPSCVKEDRPDAAGIPAVV
jgi:hypothetical protein